MKASDVSLGASEFAATLNGDNSRDILKVLKQFTKIVRKERQLALSGDDEDDSPDEGSAPSVTAIPKTKAKKAPPEDGMEPEPTA